MKGQAILAAQSPCDFVLTIKQASILTPSGQAVSRVEALEESSVRFAYQDGAIEGLCVTENDPTWSSNIKRALVSLLQNKALKNSGESLITEVCTLNFLLTSFPSKSHHINFPPQISNP